MLTKTRQPSAAVETADVDVTPIMNMFIILIPFLVSMAVFTHLSVLHFTLPPNAGTGLSEPDTKPKLKLTIVVAGEYLAITHGEEMLDSIGRYDGSYDLTTFTSRLLFHHNRSGISEEAVIAVRDEIEFRHVIKIMDICRDNGFIRIGLSNATENPRRGI
jgi:biopolymer transport protein ExbD